MQNSTTIQSADSHLAEFYSVRTNTAIPGFPTTPQDIMQMNSALLSTILIELGLDGSGNVTVKRERLRVYIGLKKVPV